MRRTILAPGLTRAPARGLTMRPFPAPVMILALSLALALTLAALAPAAAFDIEERKVFPGTDPGRELRIISTTDRSVFAPLITAFQARHPELTINYVVTSSRSLYAAIAREEAPFDLAVSSAMDLQMKLANDGFARPFVSAATAALPPWAVWRDRIFAFTQEPVVVVVSKSGMAGLAMPRTRDDLIRLLRTHPARFRGRIGTYDPEKSGAGYLFATQDARQSDTFWRLAEVMGGLEPRLYTASAQMIRDLEAGRIVLAYNVLGSYLAAQRPAWPDGAVIEPEDHTTILLRTAIIPRNAPNPALGGLFVDFLLSEEGRAVLRQKTGLAPIDEAALAAHPRLRPIRLDAGLMVFVDPLKRRRFLNEWRAAVVQP